MSKVGRPKKHVVHDPESAKVFIEKLFLLDQEKKTIQEAKKDLREEYEEKVDMKMVMSVIRLVKAELKLTCSPETTEEMSKIIKDKINMVM